MSHRLEKSTASLLQVNLSPNSTVYSYIRAEDQLTVTFVKEEKVDTRGQTVLRKQQGTFTDTEIETPKSTFPYGSISNYTMSIQEKARRLKITPLPMPKHAVPFQISPTDESLPAEIKESTRDSNVESVVFRDKTDNVNANYNIAYQKTVENSQFGNLFVMKLLLSINYA